MGQQISVSQPSKLIFLSLALKSSLSFFFPFCTEISIFHLIFIKIEWFVITEVTMVKSENITYRSVYFLDTCMEKSMEEVSVSFNA